MSSKDNLWQSKAKSLLKLLKKDDLLSLTTTFVRDMPFSSELDAIDAIISYCKTPNELLSKRKLKHEYLLRYLWEENCGNITSKSTKVELCIEVLNLWNCSSEVDASSPTIEEVLEDEDIMQTPSVSIIQSPIQFSEVSSSPSPSHFVDHSADDMILAGCFLRWFYELLTVNGQNFGSQHFFDNAAMKLCCGIEPNVMIQEKFGSADVVSCFVQLIVGERLIFNANLTPNTGFSTIRDPHGALLVKNCGVVHRDSLCIGPYDVFFVLIQEPSIQNWKIQRVSLAIRAAINQMLQ